MSFLRRALAALKPPAKKEADGRDLFPNRTAFILAAIGGAVGLGNVLRYPSVVFANSGVQWFIPYLIALVFLGIPVLLLELCLGQAYRAGVVTSFNGLSNRLKGLGMGVCLTGYIVVVYYVPILAWIMQYFRYSFHSPLQWEGRTQDFFDNVVVANVAPRPGLMENGEVVRYAEYTDMSLIGETVGWVAFIWFCVWLSMFAGVSLTGRAVYVTMGLPMVMLIILLGRSASLDNSLRGVRYYFGEWHGEKLGSGDIWQAACGQIFFSIGVGFGYFTTYASYNNRFANAVQDTLIIACSNSMFEIVAGFVVFSIIGFLDMNPVDDGQDLGTFVVGFLTYPSAIVEIPGANFWGVVWFLTIALLGVSSSVALTETLITVLHESVMLRRFPRWITATAVIVASFLLSLMYCTRFGYYLLDAVDTWVNNVTLLEIVWCEIVCVSILYRHHDVVSQVGWPAYLLYSVTYGFSQFVGVVVGQSVGPEAGAGAGFGFFIVGTVVSVLAAKRPGSVPPPLFEPGGFMARAPVLSSLNYVFQSSLGTKFWWLTLYSTHQLRRDMNLIVAQGKNWSIPVIWGPVLRYISAPILAIIASFSYPTFYNEKRMDPLHVFGFVNAHLSTLLVVIGLVVPRALDVFVVHERRNDSKVAFVPQQPNPAMMARIDGVDEMEGAAVSPHAEVKP